MKSFVNVPLTHKKLFVFISVFNCVFSLRVPDERYYPNYFQNVEAEYDKIKTALGKLEHEPQWVQDWPDTDIKLGQVSGVAVDSAGLVFVFHRSNNSWDATTFTMSNVYTGIGEKPISDPTILVFNETGALVDKWGQNLFYIPHGITVDAEGNVWVTDVALHQVFKFPRRQRDRPSITLGEKFVPGDDDEHFCKPSAVAVHSSGDFFVADGYCNSRIVKYAPDGTKVLQWGRRHGESPFVLRVPHALALAEAHDALCAADRERGRVACFRASNGTYLASYSNWLLGPRIFSVAYSSAHGGRLYVVNGPLGATPVRGYVLEFPSGRLAATFAPGAAFSNPHDVAVSPDGAAVYVAELDPHRVYRFAAAPEVTSETPATAAAAARAKPTATVEVSGAATGGAWAGWSGWGAWGGAAAGALAAAALATAALALRHARDRGRKGGPRRRWEYAHEFKLRRLLERRRFTRVHSDDSEDEPAPMLPASASA